MNGGRSGCRSLSSSRLRVGLTTAQFDRIDDGFSERVFVFLAVGLRPLDTLLQTLYRIVTERQAGNARQIDLVGICR